MEVFSISSRNLNDETKAALQRETTETTEEYYGRLAARQRKLWETDEPMKHEDVKNEIIYINELFYACDVLRNFVYQVLNTHYPTYFQSPNQKDFVNTVFLEVYKHVKEYNGKNKLSTFFLRFVIHGCQLYISEINNISRYDNENLTKIKRARTKLINLGYAESEITVSMLMDHIPGLTQTQIEVALNIEACSKTQLYDPDYENATLSTPEKAFIQQENAQILNDIFDKIPEYEKYVLLAKESYTGKTNTAFYYGMRTDENLIKLIKNAVYFNYLSTDENGNTFIPKDKISLIYKKGLIDARSTPAAKTKMHQKMRGFVGEKLNFPNETLIMKTADELLNLDDSELLEIIPD